MKPTTRPARARNLATTAVQKGLHDDWLCGQVMITADRAQRGRRKPHLGIALQAGPPVLPVRLGILDHLIQQGAVVGSCALLCRFAPPAAPSTPLGVLLCAWLHGRQHQGNRGCPQPRLAASGPALARCSTVKKLGAATCPDASRQHATYVQTIVLCVMCTGGAAVHGPQWPGTRLGQAPRTQRKHLWQSQLTRGVSST